MKTLIIMSLLLLMQAVGTAALLVKVEPPKQTGAKAVVKITLKNTFEEKIESARATVFLNDAQGKVVAQSTKWIIGGSPDSKPLAPNTTTTYNFVIDTDKSVAAANVIFSRLILEGGKLADVKKDVVIEK
jgi:hypothetical protein